jgi:hypothetical protein
MITRICLLTSAVCLLALTLAAAASAAGDRGSAHRLLARYEPVMQFDPLEQFQPTKVEPFIAASSLEQLTAGGTWSVVAPTASPGDLPGPGTGTWRLDQNACTPNAPLGGLACYAASAQQDGDPNVYARVVREDDQIVLQYWYFYDDDVYSYAYPPSDFIWQAHEGDWENVDVVLSNEAEPQFVGYSEHCLGRRRDWADTPRFDDTHPIVHVAIGSHANYFSTGTHPIDVACIPPQAVAILQRSGLPLPVDYAFAGPIAGPPGAGGSVMTIARIGKHHEPSWIDFPGFWGELQYFHAPAPIGTVASGTSPVGPAYHTEWADPLGTLAGWPEG